MFNQRFSSAPHLLCAPLAALLLTTPCLPCEDGPARSNEALRTELRAAIQTLWTGRPELQRAAVEDAEDWAEALAYADPDDEDTRNAVSWLRVILHTEKDDWIASRLLQNLPPLSSDLLNPLYRDGLFHPSPNVRWRAIQWFQAQRDAEAKPLLENLWSSEKRPWVLADLIDALAVNASERYRDDFLDLARGKDVTLALAAIRAFELLHDEALIPDLAEISRGGNPAVRQAAINALATWPESQAALDAVLHATQSADRETVMSSIPSLKNFLLEEAVRRLLELAGTHGDSQVRLGALEALEPMRPDGFVDLLVGILHEPDSEAVTSLQSEAISALNEMDDPEVLPKLSGLDPDLGGEGLGNLRDLLDNLSRDRTVSPAGERWIRLDCGAAVSRGGDGGENNQMLIAPPEGFQTVRCWEFPMVPGDPEFFVRISAGSEVRIEDHFERGAESWVQVSSSDADDCWVPWSELQAAASTVPKGSTTPEDLFRIEFDVSFEEFEGDGARALRDAGLMAPIEPGDQVVGLALALHPAEVGSIPALVNGYRDDGSLLDDAVAALLRTLLTALPNRPELQEFFRNHPDEKEEVVDSSLDELGSDEDDILIIDP